MSVQDLVVLRGRAASDVALHRSDEPEAKTFGRFRMAVPRSRRRDDGQWEEIKPQWYTIKLWGTLAEHVNLSVRRGAPVLVVGRPVAQAWINRDGEAKADIAIHAVSVGHDMVFGISSFSRLRRQTVEVEEMEEAVEEQSAEVSENVHRSSRDDTPGLVDETHTDTDVDADNLVSVEVDDPTEEDNEEEIAA
ncbi:single-stranded DNA-binding protein [Actinomycetaceae bacterium MB13-C1-2]|nr:single-stranded DNA-binding protein [Actinomycetaceae bacterium MB13-C1-2]